MPKKHILWRPNHGPQTAFLASSAREVLYGGAVGGGKTDALLMHAVRYADHPKHRALILRRTRPQLQEVIDRSLQLYPEAVSGATWREGESRWVFPSGAVIQMGYAEHEKDIYNFRTFEYNLICFDELTSFTEPMYSFMFLRNRTKSADLPLQIRSGTNPGDIGHDWVLKRFIGSKATNDIRTPYKVYSETISVGDGGERTSTVHLTRQYIPSRVWDNPSLPNKEEYIAGIKSSMSPVDVEAYLEGRWDMLAGAMFKVPPVELAEPSFLSTDYYTVRCIDYGWDDPTCVLWLVVYPETNVIDVVGELYVRETTLDSIVDLVKKKEESLKLRQPLYSIGSPEIGNIQATSNQSIAGMLSVKGVQVEPVPRTKEYRVASMAKMHQMLVHKAIRVWPLNGVHGAPNLLRTLPKLQRNTGPGKDPNDIRPRQEDHAFDALRYGIMVAAERPAQTVTPQVVTRDPEHFDLNFDKLLKSRMTRDNYIPGLGEW